MDLRKNFPYLVAFYLIAVGLFFSFSMLMNAAYLDVKPPGSYILTVLSIILIATGMGATYLLSRGKLKKAGKTITEVRIDAIEKIKDPTLLANIATGDKNQEIRKTAEKRLSDLNN